jgi:hypothetical protein
MPKFRTRPVEVEAHQWFANGDHPEDGLPPVEKILLSERSEGRVVRYFRHPTYPGHETHRKCGRTWHDHGWIDTPDGGHVVCPGDWILTDVQGDKYPCKPDVFADIYEPVTPTPTATTTPTPNP